MGDLTKILNYMFLASGVGSKKIASRILGRDILDSEFLIHLDGDKTNFNRENLFVVDENGLLRTQESLKDIFLSLMRERLIVFDVMKGTFDKKPLHSRKIIVKSPEPNPVSNNEIVKVYLDIELN